MDLPKRIVFKFLHTPRGYFHTKRIIEDSVKQPRDLYGPMSNRDEGWEYKDIRHLDKDDFDKILLGAALLLDKDLYSKIPSAALHAALDQSIWSLGFGKYQSKIDSKTYNTLCKLLSAVVES